MFKGKVHWKEYYVHFLLAKGFEKQQAEQHVVDYDQIVLDPDCKLIIFKIYHNIIINNKYF